MCGITGIWNFDGRPVSAETIAKFTDAIRHRGPDGYGYWHSPEGNVALGHRRLSILDLSDAGKQPMSFADGRYQITYNGEIYNFVEIRHELESKGYNFKTETDTEVILAAFHCWQHHMLPRFNGMWALAIMDCHEQRMFLARDRFGIKPFHFLLQNNTLAFASELKAFRHLDGYTPKMDRQAAMHFLQTGQSNEATTRTLMAGVNHLLAGHYAWVQQGRLTQTRWWHTLDNLPTPPPTFEQRAEQYRELFYDAVKLRLRSDVPVASSLSGGFDSSAVVCAIAEIGKTQQGLRQTTNWQQTFTASFPGAPLDETEDAKKVIEFSGLNGNFIEIKAEEAIQQIDNVLYSFDDVSLTFPAPPWFVYKQMRSNGYVVSMDGHGVDETIGAYRQADSAFLNNAPPIWNWKRNEELINNYLMVTRQADRVGKLSFREIFDLLQNNHPQFASFRAIVSQLKSIKDKLILPPQRAYLNKTERLSKVFEPFAANDKLPNDWRGLNKELYQMTHSTLLPGILRNFERLSSAHGVEVRMPFMDWRLMTYCFALPDSDKLSDGLTKRIARESMKMRMPEHIRTNVFKIGFNPPMPEWFSGSLHQWLIEILNQSSGHDLINTKKLKTFILNNHQARLWNWPKAALAWRYIHMLWWEQHFTA